MTSAEPIRLNLGAGDTVIEGFRPIDRKLGTEVYPLPQPSGSVEEIRASHILEHFAEGEIMGIMTEWVRVLRPAGRIKVAVPDANKIGQALNENQGVWDKREAILLACLTGGQTDANDFHKSAWTEPKLRLLMESCGLEQVAEWHDEVKDCSALPISLNLEGYKRNGVVQPERKLRVHAVASLPRLTFTENMNSIIQGMMPFGIQIRTHTGAYWGQTLTNALEKAIEDGADLIFTVDYDTIFSPGDVRYMVEAMGALSEIDALCGVQMKREADGGLLTMRGEDGELRERVPVETFAGEFTKIASGHFGLTLFRASCFEGLARPWFMGQPDPDGRWHEGRLDADMRFWKIWTEAGFSLYQANRVRLGHLQRVVTWPGLTFNPIHQYVHEYNTQGMPEEVKVLCHG